MTNAAPVSWVPVRKVVAAIAAAVLTAGPVSVLDAVGVHVPATLGVLIVGILTPLAAYLTPEKPVPAPVVKLASLPPASEPVVAPKLVDVELPKPPEPPATPTEPAK